MQKFLIMTKFFEQIFYLGFTGSFRLARDLIFTKLFCSIKSARIVRLPFSFYSKGKVFIGQGFSTGTNVKINLENKNSILNVGDKCFLNSYVHIAVAERIDIGNNVLMASKIFISDHSHGSYSSSDQSHPDIPPNNRDIVSNPIKIGDNCWIGEGVNILPGVTLGSGCIVGAGSVVTKSFKKNTILAGSPAKAIKCFNESQGIWEKL